MEKVLLFDTTLRDGEQALRSSLSVKEKLGIARALVNLGVDIIEAGFPVSSPGDLTSVATITKEISPLGPRIAGLARAVKGDIDACAEAFKGYDNTRIHTFIGTSEIHTSKKLRKSNDEIIAMAVEAVTYARNLHNNIEFSCEDAGRTDRDFMVRIVEAVIAAGATTINIPDTVGYTAGYQFGDIIKDVMNRVPNVDQAIISVHCHNDLGMATANSLQAILNGARQVECTINGIGERAGNASLEEIVMALETRKDIFGVTTGAKLSEIYPTSRLVSHVCAMPIQPNKAIVGANAFAHSSGIHQDGVLKAKNTYEIIQPETIGLKANQLNLTSRSGRHVIKHRLQLLGYTEDSYNLDKVYERFLQLADKKGSVYDDDLEALMELGVTDEDGYFKLTYLNATSGSGIVPTATVKVTLGDTGDVVQEASTGDGPVDASCRAIERATGITLKLMDYALSGVTGGRDALGEVRIIAEYNGKKYHGHGSSTDIVEASTLAYLQAINKVYMMEQLKTS